MIGVFDKEIKSTVKLFPLKYILQSFVLQMVEMYFPRSWCRMTA